MFRVRFASGEEAAYESVDDLADGIRSGAVTATAEIFHAKSQQWLPIAVHPAYEQAGARVAEGLAASAASGAGSSAEEAAQAGGFQIYQMVSQSAIELAERRKPRWIGPAVGLVGAFLFVAGLTWMSVPASTATSDPGRPLVARELGGIITPSQFATQGLRSWPNSPAQVALRLAHAGDSAAQALGAKARELGLGNLLAVDHLNSPARIQTTRGALVNFEAVLASHRYAERERMLAYTDSVGLLARAGAWNQADIEEWAVRAQPPETEADAARGDSLLVALDRLYGLLFDQEGGYQVSDEGIRFTSLAAGDEYNELRRGIQALVGPRDEPTGRHSATLVLLLALVGDGALPPHVDN